MSLPFVSARGNRGGTFAAGPAAPVATSGYAYDLDASYGIDTTPFIHWDASTLEDENSASEGSTFSTWTSREGSDYDLAQADAAEQFTYEATSSNMNSKPVAISSDGARHMMTATDFLSAGTVTMPITIIMAYHEETPTANDARFGGKDTSGNNVNHFRDKTRSIYGTITEYIYTNAAGGTGGYLTGPATQTGAHIITWELDNTATCHFYYELARTVCIGTVSSNNPFNYQFSLGADNTGGNDVVTDTEIAEVIIYNEILSDTTMSGSNVDGGELFTIISYLKSKYGIS